MVFKLICEVKNVIQFLKKEDNIHITKRQKKGNKKPAISGFL